MDKVFKIKLIGQTKENFIFEIPEELRVKIPNTAKYITISIYEGDNYD